MEESKIKKYSGGKELTPIEIYTIDVKIINNIKEEI